MLGTDTRVQMFVDRLWDSRTAVGKGRSDITGQCAMSFLLVSAVIPTSNLDFFSNILPYIYEAEGQQKEKQEQVIIFRKVRCRLTRMDMMHLTSNRLLKTFGITKRTHIRTTMWCVKN